MQTLPKIHTDHSLKLNQTIDDFLNLKLIEADSISPYYNDLWQNVATLLRAGGKRLRPRMCLLSYQAFGGDDVDSILPATVALELLHLSMLVHDDIIDRDYVRYGIKNIAGVYNTQLYTDMVEDTTERLHYAHSAAMLGGDLLLSEAYALITESTIAPEKMIAVQNLMRRAIFEVIGGELLDTESAFRGAGEVSAERIALHKTASYTFTLPMLAGAYLAGLSDEFIPFVRDFGKNLGIAFQLRDDIIGVFGDEKKSGKSTVGDIREGKRTYMIEQFYGLATDAQKSEFELYFGKKFITDQEVTIVRNLIRTSNAYDRTLNEIDRYEGIARTALAHLPVDPAYTDGIETLIEVATKRQA
jgi:geranylgeranyl diphosphate synthase type II